MLKIQFKVSPKTGKPYARLATSFNGYEVGTFDREAIKMLCALSGVNYDDMLANAPVTVDIQIIKKGVSK